MKRSFNGAAAFKLRKTAGSMARQDSSRPFNGAAAFKLRKTAGLHSYDDRWVNLQWGRSVQAAEDPA